VKLKCQVNYIERSRHLKLEFDALQSLSNIFIRTSNLEHAKSYLIESFGEIILRIEGEYPKIKNQKLRRK
jgi:hypothetical protein